MSLVTYRYFKTISNIGGSSVNSLAIKKVRMSKVRIDGVEFDLVSGTPSNRQAKYSIVGALQFGGISFNGDESIYAEFIV